VLIPVYMRLVAKALQAFIWAPHCPPSAAFDGAGAVGVFTVLVAPKVLASSCVLATTVAGAPRPRTIPGAYRRGGAYFCEHLDSKLPLRNLCKIRRR